MGRQRRKEESWHMQTRVDGTKKRVGTNDITTKNTCLWLYIFMSLKPTACTTILEYKYAVSNIDKVPLMPNLQLAVLTYKAVISPQIRSSTSVYLHCHRRYHFNMPAVFVLFFFLVFLKVMMSCENSVRGLTLWSQLICTSSVFLSLHSPP